VTRIHMTPAQHRDTAVWLQDFSESTALRLIDNLRTYAVSDDDCDRLTAFVTSKRFGTLS